MNETKLVYTLKMRLALHKEGIEPALEIPNPRNPRLIAWVYERTPHFDEVFARLYAAAKENNNQSIGKNLGGRNGKE